MHTKYDADIGGKHNDYIAFVSVKLFCLFPFHFKNNLMHNQSLFLHFSNFKNHFSVCANLS